MSPQRSVLITGCSDGGLGAALALAFHEAGLKVYATSRDQSKMKGLASKGIETMTLDVLFDESIAACARQIPSLDILVNNAGMGYSMPIADISITEAKKTFDINVWSYIAVTQAFIPLLRESPEAMIVNQTSISSVVTIPFQSVYNASKAAMVMFSDTLRLELEPFNIKVVDLRTGNVSSNLNDNAKSKKRSLPENSIYEPARQILDPVLSLENWSETVEWSAERWAKEVTVELLKGPPYAIWKGENAWKVRILSLFPTGLFDGMIKKLSKLDVVAQILRQ
ncbi:uncharacterized protein N7483_006490 [Penicillium malachiteum]|uniref:uncharacterized protein n=1 Tax=Penicillium malachiteum TaxID=1324776 RepID=UPI0025475D2A|nr:uncharacterized protein N7483_006490 [Penicillium malachiteum]KAJ5725133.1 hypothetical protein N7483_006490 [Penicillium malachiteum]